MPEESKGYGGPLVACDNDYVCDECGGKIEGAFVQRYSKDDNRVTRWHFKCHDEKFKEEYYGKTE